MSGQKWNRRTSVRLVARIAAGVLTVSAGVTAFSGVAGAAAAGGAGGTVKVDGTTLGGGADHNPHQTCGINVEFFGFAKDAAAGAPANDWSADVTFSGANPTPGGTLTSTPAGHIDFAGTTGPANALNAALAFTDLDVSGLTPQKNQGYHVNVSVTATRDDGISVSKSKVIWVSACLAQQAPLTLSSACSATPAVATWTVGNPASNVTVENLAVTGGTSPSALGTTTLAPGGTTTFTTAAPSSSLSVAGTTNPGGVVVASAAQSLADDCTTGSETPATVSFTDDCSGTNVAMVTNSKHTTAFGVTTPAGGRETVNGTGNRHYPADATHDTTSISYDGKSASHTWSEPTGCSTPPPPAAGRADPSVASSKHCAAGISVVLGDLNGTADVTFTVTSPNGKTHQVAVRQGQLVKKSYAVEEDSTGVVTVDAPGMAKQTIRYAKDCSTVLGEKHVRHVPKTQPRAELPFTGFESRRAAMLATALLLVGAALCGLGSIGPRRRTV